MGVLYEEGVAAFSDAVEIGSMVLKSASWRDTMCGMVEGVLMVREKK